MKKFTLLLFLATAVSTALAQKVTVMLNGGYVIHLYNASAEDLVFSNSGSVLTIQGNSYNTGEIKGIQVEKNATVDMNRSVTVDFASSNATVTLTADIVPYIDLTVKGAYVSAITNDTTYSDTITYNLSGSTDNGAFIADGKHASVINLNSVSISNSDTAAINFLNGKYVDVNVSGTNNLVDGATGGQKGAFFINGHARFAGDGDINITGNARHGYRSDEYTIFSEDFTGNFNVLKSASDGINVQQYLQIDNGTITIENNTGDGIDVGFTNDPTDVNNGMLYINGGTITAKTNTVDTKAIKADTLITITGGRVNTYANANGSKGISSGGNFIVEGGYIYTEAPGSSITVTLPDGTTDKKNCRALRSVNDFYYRGGTIDIQNASEKTWRVKGIFYYLQSALTGIVDRSILPTADGGYKKL